MLEAFSPLSQGSGVSEAAAYDKSKSGTHPIVILAPEDDVEDWNLELPDSWRSVYVGRTELVAVIRYLQVDLNRTRYHAYGGGTIYVTRARLDTEVKLYEAKTGTLVVEKVFEGTEPVGFPSSLPSGTQYVFGDKTSYQTVMDWLKEFVDK